MTVEFVILSDFFEIKRYKREEEVYAFVWCVFPYLHPQIKVWFLLASICFNCNYLLKILTQEMLFALLSALRVFPEV